MTLTIGQVAKSAGVTIDTIRFYEKEGLIPKPPRRHSGHRQYGHEIVERVVFIRRAKQLGFTLSEIVDILELRSDPSSTAQDVKDKASAKIQQIDAKIRELKKIRSELVSLTNACTGSGSTAECPIIESMATIEDG